MNKGCHRVKHGNKVWPAKKQENNGHPGSDTANDSPCGTHDPMCGKTSRHRVELIRSTEAGGITVLSIAIPESLGGSGDVSGGGEAG